LVKTNDSTSLNIRILFFSAAEFIYGVG